MSNAFSSCEDNVACSIVFSEGLEQRLVELSHALDVDDPSPTSGEVFVDPSTLSTDDLTKVLKLLYHFHQILLPNPTNSSNSLDNFQTQVSKNFCNASFQQETPHARCVEREPTEPKNASNVCNRIEGAQS
jgi:hypothetical protein